MSRPGAIIIFLLFAHGLYAQQNNKYDDLDIPTLNEHSFIREQSFFGPFTNTTFGMNIGFGETSQYFLPAIDLGDTVLSISGGNVLYVNIGMDYQQKVKDWISFFLRVGGTARVGTDPQSLFTQGLNTVTGATVGWNIMLLRREKVRLSGIIGLKNYTGSFVDIAGFINDIIDNNPTASLNKTVPVIQGMAGLNFAWAPTPLIGFNGTIRATYGDAFVRGNSAYDYIINAAVDFNFYSISNVPMGIMFAFLNTSHPESSFVQNENSTVFQTTIAYTGSDDFQLSFNFQRMRVPLNFRDQRVTVNRASFAITYYFN